MMAQASVKCGRSPLAGKDYKFIFAHELFGTVPFANLRCLVCPDHDY